MQGDRDGCSTCPSGQERWEPYWSPTRPHWLIHYMYYTPSGVLFSTIAGSLTVARLRCDAWLASQSGNPL